MSNLASGVRRRKRVLPSNYAKILQQLKSEASRCQTPKQFRDLLESLRLLIPYRKFVGVWGYPSRTTIRFIFNYGFPTEFLRWHLTAGALWTSPAFQQWLRIKKAVLWFDTAHRLKTRFNPELLRRVEEAQLQYALYGGSASRERFILFVAAMPSLATGRAYHELFKRIVPWLARASQRAYPHALLTKRETIVLERRARGEIIKQIASAEGMNERTVREHLQTIKRKLYTNDLVNAVVIAVKSGMILPSSA